MSYTPKIANGQKRKEILRARRRVLTKAYKRGWTTNAEAKKIGRWAQSWYHLNALAEAGYLKKEEYDRWRYVERAGEPKLYGADVE
jgi:hypothetical protein